MEEEKILDVDDLKWIKKHYGENLAKFCRSNFPSILEHRGILATILKKHFAPTHSLYDDLKNNNEFGKFIQIINYSLKDYVSNTDVFSSHGKSPEQLLREAGYTLYPECRTKKDVLKFKKYYASGEELCSFRGDRTKSCRVWFAVKDGAEKLIRKDFTNPQRQDEYGISVISIQFSKYHPHSLSIKNRYNHTVWNPDSTFSNDLDNIIPGLTEAFEIKYGAVCEYIEPEEVDIKFISYTKSGSGERYRVTSHMYAGCYFCENNYIIYLDGTLKQFDTSRYVLFENYLLDLKEKKVAKLDKNGNMCTDTFTDSICEDGNEIKKIEIEKDGTNKIIHIIKDDGKDCYLSLNQNNSLIGYKNDYLIDVGDDFLENNTLMEFVDLPNALKIGKNFLWGNEKLKRINTPKVTVIGDNCLVNNNCLLNLELPNVLSLGTCFMQMNNCLQTLVLPKVENISNGCFLTNETLTHIYVPKLVRLERDCFFSVKNIEKLDLPSLELMESYVFFKNNSIKQINAPKLEKMDVFCFANNRVLIRVNMGSLKYLGYGCFEKNKILRFFLNLRVKANNKKSEKNEEKQP